jgi:hypothetical protein
MQVFSNHSLKLKTLVVLGIAQLVFSTAVVYAAESPPPGQVVITFDPQRDLVAAAPGWSQVVETPGPRGTTGCLDRHIQHKAPLPLNAFTVSEVTSLAQKAKRLVAVPTPAGSVSMIRVGKQLVTVTSYAEQLNDIEKFLNTFGRSLREVQPDLGVVASLRDANISQGCGIKANQYEPVWRDPRIPIAALIKDWKLEDEVPGWLTSMSDLRRLYDTNKPPVIRQNISKPPVIRRRDNPLHSITTDNLAMARLQNRKALLAIKASDMAAPSTRESQRSKGVNVLDVHHTGTLKPLIQLKAGRRPNTINFDVNGTTSTTMSLQSDCPIQIDGGAATEGISLHGGRGSSGGGSTRRDNRSPFIKTEGTPSACLIQGSFSLVMEPWKSCITTGGSFNNWFGGASCIHIASKNTGNNGVMAFEDTINMGANLTILGLDMSLMGVHAGVSSSTQKGPIEPKPTASGLVSDLGGGTSCCDPIAGPSAYIPIGPAGLLVTSALDVKLDAGNMTTKASAIPIGCSKGLRPLLKIDGKASATAGANFDAAISFLVASAGIEGSITLVGGDLVGGIITQTDMGNNLVTVDPRASFNSKIGGGKVNVFVEVDMLVYSKRWSINLVEWKPYTTTNVFPHDRGTVRASVVQSTTCLL